MKNIRTAVISGIIALAAIAATVIIILSGGSKGGLYILEVTGGVNVSNSNDGTSLDAEAEMELSPGDVLTVGEESSCKLFYKTGRNSGSNYMVLLSNSQLFVTEELDGKNDANIYLNRGTIISCNAEDLGACANIRTANSAISTARSVNVITYAIGDKGAYTEAASLGGNIYIQLYDSSGNEVNKREPLGPKMKGRIVSGDDGPSFGFLNNPLSLSDLSSQTLRELFTISSFVQLEFTSAEIKEAYDAIPKEEKTENEPDVLEEIPIPTGDGTIQTAETIATLKTEATEETSVISETESETETEETTTVTEETTTTTVSSEDETEPEETEETEETDESFEISEEDPEDDPADEIFTVYVYIDGNLTTQQVAYGESASQPPDPIIEGKIFLGWDNTFENITEDRTISAMFEEAGTSDTETSAEAPSENSHVVTVVIGDKTTTQIVNHGEAASIPSTVTLEGYTFKGWDGDYTNITSDVTITAILEPMSCNITFVIDGVNYFTTVSYGGTAAPPIIPSVNSNGQSFMGWDKELSGITSDTTITALYEAAASYTVTFVIEGMTYTQTVTAGQAAAPPEAPAVNEYGQTFRGWDNDYSNITSNMTITAVYS